MKTAMSWLLGLALMLLSSLAFANATVASISGEVEAGTPNADGDIATRPLRRGDIVRSGEVVTTGRGATVVLRFTDGHIVALTPLSALHIEEYRYDERTKTGGALFELFTGALRTVTGLIGKSSPDRVAFRAGVATIGIRGTEGVIATDAFVGGGAGGRVGGSPWLPSVGETGNGGYVMLAFNGPEITGILSDASGSSERVMVAAVNRAALRASIRNRLLQTISRYNNRSPGQESQQSVAVTVTNGQMTFTLGGQTVTINTGQGVFSRPGVPVTVVSAQAVIDAIRAAAAASTDPATQASANAIANALATANSQTIINQVNQAVTRSQTPGTTGTGTIPIPKSP